MTSTIGGLCVSILSDAFYFSLTLLSSSDASLVGEIGTAIPFTSHSIRNELHAKFDPFLSSYTCKITCLTLPPETSEGQKHEIFTLASSLPIAISEPALEYTTAYCAPFPLADLPTVTLFLHFLPTKATVTLVQSATPPGSNYPLTTPIDNDSTRSFAWDASDDPVVKAGDLVRTIVDPLIRPALRRVVLTNADSAVAEAVEHILASALTPVSVIKATPADLSHGAAVSGFRDTTRPTRLRAQYVMPVAASVATASGDAAVLIPSDFKLPIFKKMMFTTSVDNQSRVAVHLALGNHRRASDNLPRGSVVLEGLRPMQKGAARIRVTVIVSEGGEATVAVRQVLDDEPQSDPPTGITAKLREIREEISGLQTISKVVKFPSWFSTLGNDYGKYDVAEGPLAATFLTDGVAGELPEH